MSSIATLKGLKCPQCGSEDLLAVGKRGAGGGEIAAVLLGGAVANLIVSRNAVKEGSGSAEPLGYRCRACKAKFQSLPLTAAGEDVLSAPCTIYFTRLGSFVGAMVAQVVYLNGVRCGAVKNGKTISFQTSNRWNTLFVTDQYGVAFADMYRFEAVPGGVVEVKFNRKFVE